MGWWVGNHDFLVQIWIFHAVPSKEKCCKLIPPPMAAEGWQTMHFLAKMIFIKLTQPIPMQTGRVSKNEVLCADLDISCIFHQNKFLVKLPLTSHPWGWGLLSLGFVHFRTFNGFSIRKILLVNWAPFHMLDLKSLEFLGKSVFNYTL